MTDVMQVATEAGHIMLENGAEIFRVEETMERITRHYGVDSGRFFVLSNGILTSGGNRYSNVEFIPFKGAQLEKVVAVNRLSRAIEKGGCTIQEARERLAEIRNMKATAALSVPYSAAAFWTALHLSWQVCCSISLCFW